MDTQTCAKPFPLDLIWPRACARRGGAKLIGGHANQHTRETISSRLINLINKDSRINEFTWVKVIRTLLVAISPHRDPQEAALILHARIYMHRAAFRHVSYVAHRFVQQNHMLRSVLHTERMQRGFNSDATRGNQENSSLLVAGREEASTLPGDDEEDSSSH